MALATPFVDEAVHAGLESALSEIGDPFELEADPPDAREVSIAWRAWQVRRTEETNWARRRAFLEKNDRSRDGTDLAAWRLVRFADEAGELWSYKSETTPGRLGWINDRLDVLFAPAPVPGVEDDRRVLTILAGKRLMTLARLMFADAEEIGGHLIDRADNDYLAAVSAGEGAGQWTTRPYRLLPLLAVACQMTLDPRRMPDVVAEHIGLDPQFDLDAVCEALSRAVWHHAGNPPAHRLRLDLICPHQALDHALRLKVADLNTLNRARRLALIQSRLRV